MKRLFWMGVGAAVGVAVTRRVNRAARHLTPGGFADDIGDALRELAGAVGSFGADVRAGMAEREHELHRMVDDRTGIPTDHSGRDGDRDAAEPPTRYAPSAAPARGAGSGARASRAAN